VSEALICEHCGMANETVANRTSIYAPAPQVPLLLCDGCLDWEAYRADYKRVHPEGEP
jgi:hypothetical protein